MMVCWGEVNGNGYTLRSLALLARSARSAGPHRSPTPRRQEGAEARALHRSAGPAPLRARPRAEADGPRRRSAYQDATGTPARPQPAPRPRETAPPAPPGRPRPPAPGAFLILPARGRPPLTFNRHDVLAMDRTNWIEGAAGGRERGGCAEAASGRGGAPRTRGWRGPEGSRGRGWAARGPRAQRARAAEEMEPSRTGGT